MQEKRELDNGKWVTKDCALIEKGVGAETEESGMKVNRRKLLSFSLTALNVFWIWP